MKDRQQIIVSLTSFPAAEALKAESPLLDVRFDPAEIRSYKKLLPALRDFPKMSLSPSMTISATVRTCCTGWSACTSGCPMPSSPTA